MMRALTSKASKEDLDKVNKNGQTPLHIALIFGHTQIVKYLSELTSPEV